jgi:hypothetical protein
MLSWGRLQTLLEATIIQADPVGAEQQAAAAAQERFVRLGRNSEHGLKLIIARATAGDAIWFKATIDRIADILTHQGDTDPVEVRRSKAIGILAQPARALQLLCQHQHDHWDGPTEPTEPTDNPEEPTGDEEETVLADPAQDAGPADPAQEAGPADRAEEAGPADAAEESAETNDDEGAFAEAEQDAEPAEDADVTAAARTTQARRQPSSDLARGVAGNEDTRRSLQLTPPPFHPDRARPRAVIYIHLSEEAVRAGNGIARVEDVGPLLLNRLRSLLGEHCTINLKPVIDLPAGQCPVDSYDIPTRLREQLHLRYPADVFPYAAAVSRRIDLDHTIPYLTPDQGGSPGQTRIGNLGPHTRRHHRHKTFGGWQVRQPEPGTWLWRSPNHRIYLVNATGTHPLGDTTYAHTIWRAANPPHDLAS